MGDLYVVPTPIGNLEDITLRALRVLQSVSLIAAEDTRHSRKLLNHYSINTRLTSYHEHNKQSKTGALLDFLASGDVALITDAGTPGISDPGYELIARGDRRRHPRDRAAGRERHHDGAERFRFADATRSASTASRRAKMANYAQFLSERADFPETLIFYESPNRLVKTLGVMRDVFGERQAVVGLEVTKLFEEFARGTFGELIDHFSREPIRGEVTLLVAGLSNKQKDSTQRRKVKARRKEI